MKRFRVLVTIENKAEVGDPEGDTIKKDLIIRGGYNNVESVKSAKCYKIVIVARSNEDAKVQVTNLCEKLRIFNPVVSTCLVNNVSRID
jgi:phosphoribosylformylglycinamidine synthase, purS protein